MAKITSKANLTLGTNLFLHIADKGGTDIAIDATGGQITSTTTDFTDSSTTAGIVNRAIVVGDELEVSHTANNANEGIVIAVTAVTANQIDFTVVSGTPADEAAGDNINLVARKKTYQFVEAGALDFVDGVAGGVLHSELIDLWSANDLDRYAPPFTSIEPRAKSMANINFWEPHDTDTLNALRDMALEIRDTATTTARRVYALLRTNGDLHAPTDQMFFWFSGDNELDPPTAAVMTGYLNQLVLIRDTDNSIDKRGNWVVRCAEPGKTILYAIADIQFAEIITVPDNNEIDPKLANPGSGVPFVSDATIGAGGIYANIQYFLDNDEIYSGDVDGTFYDFAGYVEGDNRTNEQVHAKVNYLWRQGVDVNSDGTGPTKRGDKQPPLTTFSGDVFTVQAYLENFSTGQRNNLRVVDTGGTTRSWPLINTITITPSGALGVGGTLTVYHADTWGTSLAVVLQDETATPQQDVAIAASVPIVFAYSTYSVDGHSPGTPLDIRVAYSRPGFIEAGVTEPVTLDGTDKTVSLSIVPDPSYVAA